MNSIRDILSDRMIYYRITRLIDTITEKKMLACSENMGQINCSFLSVPNQPGILDH